jgi:hypothetical protein
MTLQDDAVWEDWLHSVMRLLLGSPILVQLPLDINGKPDFMDAWCVCLVAKDAHLPCSRSTAVNM